MRLDEIKEEANEIPPTRNYWFVRTDSGTNFDTFYTNSFIGIGWNKISYADITSKSDVEVKTKVAKEYDLDLKTPKGRSAATSIYNKIVKFSKLQEGDLIVIPAPSSARLAFGIISDNHIYSDQNKIAECDYIKRRKVDWFKIKSIHELDSIFYKITKPIQTIYNIKEYQNYIDNITDDLYEKEGYTHFVLRVKSEKEIDLKILADLMSSIQILTKHIDGEFELNDKKEPLTIKLNVQSPGLMELKRKMGVSIVILSTLLASCSDGQIEKTGSVKVDSFAVVHKDLLIKINKGIDTLEIISKNINKP